MEVEKWKCLWGLVSRSLFGPGQKCSDFKLLVFIENLFNTSLQDRGWFPKDENENHSFTLMSIGIIIIIL